jgi:hypothetical protein
LWGRSDGVTEALKDCLQGPLLPSECVLQLMAVRPGELTIEVLQVSLQVNDQELGFI